MGAAAPSHSLFVTAYSVANNCTTTATTLNIPVV